MYINTFTTQTEYFSYKVPGHSNQNTDMVTEQ